MSTFPPLILSLPDWVHKHARPRQVFSSLEDRMRFVISLAACNVEEGTGGPFGAAVFEIESGELIAPGVNSVQRENCSIAHAEAMALAVAQRVLGTFDLGAPQLPRLELVTSAQPCIQCWGNVWWSGVKRLVVGASVQETQDLGGFDEGPVPSNWAEILRTRTPVERSVEVIERVLSDEACAVFKRYREKNGLVY